FATWLTGLITQEDLLRVAAEIEMECARWRRSLATDSSRPAATVPHSPDFCSVLWGGQLFVFTPIQAACVSVMWKAWEGKTPVMHQAAILEEADSTAGRLRDVFRQGKKYHEAWGKMIVEDARKGMFRLADPGPPPQNP